MFASRHQLLVATTKSLRKQVKGGSVSFPSQFKDTVCQGGEVWWQGPEAADYTVSVTEAVSDELRSFSLFFFSSGLQPIEWGHIQPRGGCLSTLINLVYALSHRVLRGHTPR